jgi:hypothetical protein
VSETLPKHLRGYGTTIIATVGLMGAVFANYIASTRPWSQAFFIGGGLGIMLLLARVSVFESGIFLQTREKKIQRGNFFQLFSTKERFRKFMGCIFIGLPIWYCIGILITFSPEFARELGINGAVSAGNAVMYSYIGLAVGDLISGLSSQLIKSRKKIVSIFIVLTLIFVLYYLFQPSDSVEMFYVACFFLGTGIGYWALFVTIAAEQFGTNLRSTVATTVPNVIRGTVVPLTLLFKLLREHLGIIQGALAVGIMTIVVAFIALRAIDETYGRDMNFEEID